jgi:putative multiple sugar transport system permease protein
MTAAAGSAPGDQAPASVGRTLATLFRSNARQYGMLLALVIVIVIFQITTNGKLLGSLNVTNVFLQNGYIVLMALGMLLVIVVGHIDLSVGSVAAFTGAVAAVLMVDAAWKMDPLLAGIIALAIGGLIGAWHGFWIAYMGIPSFIATLSGMLLFRGLTLFMLQGQPVGPFPESFRAIASGFIPDPIANGGNGGTSVHVTSLVLAAALVVLLVLSDLRARREQTKYGFAVSPFFVFAIRNTLLAASIMFLAWLMANYNGLPVVLVLMLILTGAYIFVTNRTVIGRRLYAVGGNAKAAMLSGVNSKRLVFAAFVNMGVLAALGGLVFAARLNSATPKAGGGFELDVIASVFVGGASAYGGVGTVFGAVIGALFLGVLNIGMGIMSIGIDYQQAIKALVLLGAVYFDVSSKRKAG